ncbi:MAG: SDR family NAD(P)-dependent oxidoreductase [Gammaproteobacteria bacterium]
MNLSEAKAIVTGGASGLGHGVAKFLLEAGASVAVLDLAVEGEATQTLGADVTYFRADVSAEAEVDAAVESAASKLGGITLLVNCAGIVASQRIVGRDSLMSQRDFAKVINVNLIGTFTVCRAVAAVMQHNTPNDDGERGVIVNTASIAAFDGQIGQSAYAASKGGVVSMTLPLARELTRMGVRVVTIAPGLFETPMMMQIPESAREELARSVPFPSRLGQPAEFATLVGHIYQNPMLNGETIRLDAALRMQPK